MKKKFISIAFLKVFAEFSIKLRQLWQTIKSTSYLKYYLVTFF